MPLPGTVISNAALDATQTRQRCYKLYTQKRAKDRSYKIWGHFSKPDADALAADLSKRGAHNVRIVMGGYSNKFISGVRFEY